MLFKNTPVQNYYLGLMTNLVNPDVNDQIGSGITEVAGTDYARILLTRDTDWLVAGPLAESLIKIFNVGPGGWLQCNGFMVCLTPSGNDAIFTQPFPAAMQGDYDESDELEVNVDIMLRDYSETCDIPEPTGLDRMLSIAISVDNSYIFGIRGYDGVPGDGTEIYRSEIATPNVFTKVFEADHPLIKIKMVSTSLGWPALKLMAFGLNGGIYDSVDNGITWNKLYENADYIINDMMYFYVSDLDLYRLIAIGTNVNPSNPSAVFYSDDEGETWTKIDVAANRNLTVMGAVWDWEAWADIGINIFANDDAGNIYRLFFDGESVSEFAFISGLTPNVYVAATAGYFDEYNPAYLSDGSIYTYSYEEEEYVWSTPLGEGINNFSFEAHIRFE